MKRALLVMAVIVAAQHAATRAQVDAGLFVAEPAPAGGAVADAAVTRQRWVSIDFPQLAATLPNAPGAAAGAPALTLNLFADVVVVATLERVEPTSTGYVWVGSVADQPDSRVTLAVTRQVLSGTVVVAGGTYTIRPVNGVLHVVQQINEAALPREAEPLVPALPPAAGAVPPIAADDGSLIDLLVVYTPTARSLQGGTSGIEALIDLGVSETNQAYAASGAIQRLRLVATHEIAYAESGNMSTDLNRLASTSDGIMDSVHTLRNLYGADLVQLIEHSTDFCGIAYLMTFVSTGFASSAFGVTHHTCISPNLSFGHEMGHNMGLHHDMYVTGSSTGAFAYSRGYVNQAAFAPGAPASSRWRDIMAYNNQCAAAGFNCSRLLTFSNPLNFNNGDPMGSASTADAVRSLNDTRVTVSNFRASVSPTPNLTINDVTVIEGHGGVRSAIFTASLSAPAGAAVTFTYATADGTALAAASDYVAGSGPVTIGAGSTTQTITVTVNGDTSIEASEQFTVNLSGVTGATLTDGQGIGRIRNDDFTDNVPLSGLRSLAVHVTELRTLVNEIRAEKGLAAFSFADSTLLPGMTLRGLHVAELRTALADAYSASGLTPPTYTDPVITPGLTMVRAAHITELRSAAVNLP